MTSVRPMLHHISFGVADLEGSAKFYDAALHVLRYVRVWSDVGPGEENQAIGYGRAGSGDRFAIKLAPGMKGACGPGFDLAFAAWSRQAVDDFHRAALAAGGFDIRGVLARGHRRTGTADLAPREARTMIARCRKPRSGQGRSVH
jgi:catechol 2,3-dioxygenase-like lactoylglutathione lyase family enzyme